MQAIPDYTQQLNRIAEGLNRPSTPQWIYLFLGALITLLIQLALKEYDAWRKRRKMRKLVYGDILHMFDLVRFVQGRRVEQGSFNDLFQWQMDELKRGLGFYGEEYFKKERESFEDLPERYDILSVYDRYHRILDDSPSFNVNMSLAVRITASAFAKGTLKVKWLKKCLPNNGDAVLGQMRAMYREDEERLEEIMAREASAQGGK